MYIKGVTLRESTEKCLRTSRDGLSEWKSEAPDRSG